MVKESEKRARKKIVVNTRKSIDVAPGDNQKRYLRLPPKLKLFEGTIGTVYRTIFLPWEGGKYNETATKEQPWVWNRHIAVHRFLGPEGEDHLCPRPMGKSCAVCEQFVKLRARGHRDDKDYWKEVLGPLRPQARELYFIYVESPIENKGLYVWDEATFNFGEAFRTIYRRKEEWQRFADPEGGSYVDIEPRKATLGGGGTYTSYTQGIMIEPRKKPLPDELLDAIEKYRIDDFVIETPNKVLKQLVGSSGEEGGNGEAQEEETVEEVEERPTRRRAEAVEEDEPEKPARRRPEPKEEEEERPRRSRKPEKVEEPEEEPEPDDDDGDDDDDDPEEEEFEETVEEDEPEKPAPRKPKGGTRQSS